MLAVTAVEDLLQDDVKKCIVDFRLAGISVWMLTGDKGLTAQEIGATCGLISEEAKADTEAEQEELQKILPETNTVTEGNLVHPCPSNTLIMPKNPRNNRIFTLSEQSSDPLAIHEEVKFMNRARKMYKKH